MVMLCGEIVENFGKAIESLIFGQWRNLTTSIAADRGVAVA
jgi:hypothetical protein